MRDLFATTIGLHSSDYTHPLCLTSSNHPDNRCVSNSGNKIPRPWYAQENNNSDDKDEHCAEIEHELSDRYLWQPSDPFLEFLDSMTDDHPAKQYFGLHAAKDLCFKSSGDDHLREYNDQIQLCPPTSGLVLPPHRLYITLIHYCIDMLTLPNPAHFQNQPRFKFECMLLELVALFLVPTDEFSPRGPDRIYNAAAWVDHGAVILKRVRRFMGAKVAQYKANGEEGENGPGVPSSTIPREILYLGTERWGWIAQSLTVLLAWIQVADSNPSMVPPYVNPRVSILGKHGAQPGLDARLAKRQRLRRRLTRS